MLFEELKHIISSENLLIGEALMMVAHGAPASYRSMAMLGLDRSMLSK